MNTRNSLFKKLVPSCKVGPDDRRLVLASVPVLLFFISAFSMQMRPFYGLLFDSERALARKQLQEQVKRSRVYPVLVKQIQEARNSRKEIPALSDVDASGSGGLSVQQGFHSLSPHESLSAPKQRQRQKQRNKQRNKQSNNQRKVVSQARNSFPIVVKQNSRPQLQPSPIEGSAKQFRIPSNYRFRQDFLLRFDGSTLLSLPRKKLAGFAYFRQMIRKIRENFAPPGINYMFRDRAGYVMNQPIKAQVVQVLFALDPMGNVSDVRKVYSLNQKLVDEACLNSLRNKNFGKPPSEIFKKGNIFGINFVFPKLRR